MQPLPMSPPHSGESQARRNRAGFRSAECGTEVALDRTDKRLGECVDVTYGAARGVVTWDAVVDFMASVFPGTKVAIVANDVVPGRAMGVVSAGYEQKHVRDYVSHYARINPWAPHMGRMPLLRSAISDAVYPSALFQDHAFYQEFLSEVGEAESAAAIKLYQDPARSSHLSLLYGSRLAETYNRSVRRFLSDMAPHLGNAVAISADLEAARQPASTISGLVHQFQAAAFLLDPDGVVHEVNERGQQLFEQKTIVSLTERDQLWIANPEASLRLSQVLETPDISPLGAVGTNDAPTAWRFLQFPQVVRDPRLAWLAGGGKWVIALFGSSRAATLMGTRSEDFGLTKQETKIAAALVDGLTTREIADVYGVSVETVRHHLKSIFVKTDTHRQAELVSLLISSPRWSPDNTDT